jgi:signal transduction histidine kinase/HAMP domain-containing protein
VLNTLKFKIAAVYIFLVLTIAVVGVTSILNIFSLNRAIDGLMVNNYKSINAITNMLEAVEEQNNAISTYIYEDRTKGIDVFHEKSDTFYEWYNIELNNITETGEKDQVAKINANYSEFLKLFSDIQEVNNAQGTEAAVNYYENNISPTFSALKEDLNQLAHLNEQAMFRSKGYVTSAADKSMYIIISLSTVSVLGGFLISRYSTNRTLKPIYSLTETVKAVKEGHLDLQAPVISQDEIGELTKEFNNMTERLHKLEKSNLGKILSEKNKTMAIVKSISDPLIVLDNNYKVVLLNKACEEVFSIREADAANKYFLEVIRNGDLYDFIYNSSKTKGGNTEEKIIHADFKNKGYYFNLTEEKIININLNNTGYYFNVVVTVVRDIEANMNGVIVLFQNVTELKELDKIKSDFISTISHEFKTPLTSIMIGTSLILDENVGPLNESQQEIIETIKEDGDKLNSLVNNLLNLAKLEYSQSIFNISPCSVSEIIRTSVVSFQEQANMKNISLHYEINEGLPKINADAEKIIWVLNNLISNALKYTESNGEILVLAFAEDNEVCISVSDTGSGIPKEYTEKIFDRFVQVRGENSDVKGTGLGLAIAREIVQAHGGEIWCQSKKGNGATFTFTLPVAEKKL